MSTYVDSILKSLCHLPPSSPQCSPHGYFPMIFDKRRKNNANNVLQETDKHHATILCEQVYIPCIRKFMSNPKINEQHIIKTRRVHDST